MKHINPITILLLFIGINSYSFAQDEIPNTFDTYHKNIFVEFFGSSILIGANYDMRLNKGRMDGIGFRAGIGGLPQTSISNALSIGVVTFPLEFNHIVGSKRSGFISGIGILPAYATASGGDSNGNVFNVEGFGLAGGFMNLGYRLQPIKKAGFMMQLNWNPMLIRGSGITPGWIGISMGIGFK